MKLRNLLLTLALFCGVVYAATTMQALLSASATGAGDAFHNIAGMKTYQAAASTTAGTGTAVVVIQGSNDASCTTCWDPVGTVTLSLTTTTVSSSFNSDDRHAWIRANVTTLSGSTPTVSVTRSY
jgi:glutamate 5-kinase